MDLSIYSDLVWDHPQTGRTYLLRDSHVALEGTGMRLLVRPPDSEDYAVIKIKGLFQRRIITVAMAPSKTKINKELDHYRQNGVLESTLIIP